MSRPILLARGFELGVRHAVWWLRDHAEHRPEPTRQRLREAADDLLRTALNGHHGPGDEGAPMDAVEPRKALYIEPAFDEPISGGSSRSELRKALADALREVEAMRAKLKDAEVERDQAEARARSAEGERDLSEGESNGARIAEGRWKAAYEHAHAAGQEAMRDRVAKLIQSHTIRRDDGYLVILICHEEAAVCASIRALPIEPAPEVPTKPARLACSRCGKEVTKSYQPGRCYDDQCEPAEMDEHDEAAPWEDVNGATESAADTGFEAGPDLYVRTAKPTGAARALEEWSTHERKRRIEQDESEQWVPASVVDAMLAAGCTCGGVKGDRACVSGCGLFKLASEPLPWDWIVQFGESIRAMTNRAEPNPPQTLARAWTDAQGHESVDGWALGKALRSGDPVAIIAEFDKRYQVRTPEVTPEPKRIDDASEPDAEALGRVVWSAHDERAAVHAELAWEDLKRRWPQTAKDASKVGLAVWHTRDAEVAELRAQIPDADHTHTYEAGRRHERNAYLEEKASLQAEVVELRRQVKGLRCHEECGNHGAHCLRSECAGVDELKSDRDRLQREGEELRRRLDSITAERDALTAWQSEATAALAVAAAVSADRDDQSNRRQDLEVLATRLGHELAEAQKERDKARDKSRRVSDMGAMVAEGTTWREGFTAGAEAMRREIVYVALMHGADGSVTYEARPLLDHES